MQHHCFLHNEMVSLPLEKRMLIPERQAPPGRSMVLSLCTTFMTDQSRQSHSYKLELGQETEGPLEGVI